MNKAEYAKKKNAERIANAVEQLRSSEGWQSFLRTKAQFHNYSFHNALLIFGQNPKATKVAGFRAWTTKFHRRVKKGAKAIWILAPVTRKNDDGEREVIFFKGVKVFDVSDTEPIDDTAPPITPPKMDELTSADHFQLWLDLCALADDHEIKVDTEDTKPARGYYQADQKRIAVDEALHTDEQVLVLCHELCHAFGASYKDFGREDAEAIAESAAFLVADSLGLPTDRSTVYITAWSEAEPTRLEELASTACEIAKPILKTVQARISNPEVVAE